MPRGRALGCPCWTWHPLKSMEVAQEEGTDVPYKHFTSGDVRKKRDDAVS